MKKKMKTYKNGLIIGKFMPFHLGHEELITFGLQRSKHLIIGVCSLPSESIPGSLRYERVQKTYQDNPNVTVVHITQDLPSSSEASRDISLVWSIYLKKEFPQTDVLFTSEQYGDYVAEYMDIKHECFDQLRSIIPISGTMIRQAPFTYRNYINHYAQSYFIKKVIIVGSESTGKSTMTELLANYYDTIYVPEMARLIISSTKSVVYDDLYDIANLHAKEIKKREQYANKLLFIDSDSNITASYSQFLFKKDLHLSDNIKQANQGNLYIFLNTDCPYIQDGTRIDKSERKNLEQSHKKQLRKNGITYHTITGDNRDDRFSQCINIIEQSFNLSHTHHHDRHYLTLSQYQYYYLQYRRLSDELHRIYRDNIQYSLCVSCI